jgi:predicted HD phosphohydrolase
MSEQEILDFEAEPFYREALELRKWDDTAKVQDMKVPEATEYLPDLIRTLIA